MTQDEIIEMANKAYAIDDGKPLHPSALFHLEAFAKLVAAKEREACANLCWKSEDDNAFVNSYNGKRIDLLCSELIRARGQA
jgi:hypothetical protein